MKFSFEIDEFTVQFAVLVFVIALVLIVLIGAVLTYNLVHA